MIKAIRVHTFGGPEVLQFEDVDDPVPGAGEVVVKLAAIGVNPVETYIRQGIYGLRPFPFTPGTDAAGTIESAGSDTSGLKPGQRVYLAGAKTGTYAQKAVCSVDQVHPLPDHVTFSQGAALGIPYATAHRALFGRALARAGETVLIHGASGAVGTAAVQLAHHAGMFTIGTAGSDAGRTLVRAQGADHVLDHGRDGYLDQVMEITSGRGVDVILEMLANVNLGRDLTILSPRGRVIVIGSRGDVQINPRETMRRDADIRGMTLMNASAQDLATIHAALVAGLRNRTLNPIVRTELPLAEAARAHELVMSPNAHGKIVMVP